MSCLYDTILVLSARTDRNPIIRSKTEEVTDGGPEMKRKRFTEEQIIGALKEHEDGASVADLARRQGIIKQSIYRSLGCYQHTIPMAGIVVTPVWPQSRFSNREPPSQGERLCLTEFSHSLGEAM